MDIVKSMTSEQLGLTILTNRRCSAEDKDGLAGVCGGSFVLPRRNEPGALRFRMEVVVEPTYGGGETQRDGCGIIKRVVNRYLEE